MTPTKPRASANVSNTMGLMDITLAALIFDIMKPQAGANMDEGAYG